MTNRRQLTHRLYYDDSYGLEFVASVTRLESRGDRVAVWLDRSAFYPTTGGQPFDVGILEEARVVEVVEEDGDVVHLVEGGRLVSGALVHGAIDWQRRFDHMQQHTGQHMLSAAFVRRLQAPTVSFHLGSEQSTIDLTRDLNPEEIAAAEDDANVAVWQDRVVRIRYAEADDVVAMGLRKRSTRGGTLRLIDIADYDLSACGGTHVATTGAVGLIAVTGWERFKGGVRIEFACGARALRRHRFLRDTVVSSTRRLSVLPDELPAALERLQNEQRDQRRLFALRELELARYRADALALRADSTGLTKIVVEAHDGDASSLKLIATTVADRPGHVVVLLSTAAPVALVVTRAVDCTLASHEVVQAMCRQFGGRGGGKSELAQAGGLTGSREDMLKAARQLVLQALAG